MRIDVDAGLGYVAFDDEGLRALQSAVEIGHAEGEAADALRIDGVAEAIGVTLSPLVDIQLVAAGPVSRLVHSYWIGEDLVAATVAQRNQRRRLFVTGPGFLAAALVRAVAMETNPGPVGRASLPHDPTTLDDLVSEYADVRRERFDQLAVTSAWRMTVSVDGEAVAVLWATDDTNGLRLFNDQTAEFEPISNRDMYRIFSSLLMGVTSDG